MVRYSKYACAVLAIIGFSAVSSGLKTNSMIGGGLSSLLRNSTGGSRGSGVTNNGSITNGTAGTSSIGSPGSSSVKILKTGIIQSRTGQPLAIKILENSSGNFRSTPGAGGSKLVEFQNFEGKSVKYIEPSSAIEKLLIDNGNLVREKYLGDNGQVKYYLGIRGSWGGTRPKTSTSSGSEGSGSSRSLESSGSSKSSSSGGNGGNDPSLTHQVRPLQRDFDSTTGSTYTGDGSVLGPVLQRKIDVLKQDIRRVSSRIEELDRSINDFERSMDITDGVAKTKPISISKESELKFIKHKRKVIKSLRDESILHFPGLETVTEE